MPDIAPIIIDASITHCGKLDFGGSAQPHSPLGRVVTHLPPTDMHRLGDAAEEPDGQVAGGGGDVPVLDGGTQQQPPLGSISMH